jgi:hypothetical protein
VAENMQERFYKCEYYDYKIVGKLCKRRIKIRRERIFEQKESAQLFLRQITRKDEIFYVQPYIYNHITKEYYATGEKWFWNYTGGYLQVLQT